MPTAPTQDQPFTFADAVERLRRRGVVLRMYPGFYSVHVRGGDVTSAYRTEELADAFRHGMQLEIAPSQPPLGPIGGGMTRRALMYRHNRKLALRRAAIAARNAMSNRSAVMKPLIDEFDPTDEIEFDIKT